MDVSNILFFFCSGRGKGESEAPGGGGVGFLLKIPRGGGGRFQEGEGPGGCLQRIGDFLGGGGGQIFFFGPETSTKSSRFSLVRTPEIY